MNSLSLRDKNRSIANSDSAPSKITRKPDDLHPITPDTKSLTRIEVPKEYYEHFLKEIEKLPSKLQEYIFPFYPPLESNTVNNRFTNEYIKKYSPIGEAITAADRPERGRLGTDVVGRLSLGVSAGNYLCSELTYHISNYSEKNSTRSGFIHVPADMYSSRENSTLKREDNTKLINSLLSRIINAQVNLQNDSTVLLFGFTDKSGLKNPTAASLREESLSRIVADANLGPKNRYLDLPSVKTIKKGEFYYNVYELNFESGKKLTLVSTISVSDDYDGNGITKLAVLNQEVTNAINFTESISKNNKPIDLIVGLGTDFTIGTPDSYKVEILSQKLEPIKEATKSYPVASAPKINTGLFELLGWSFKD